MSDRASQAELVARAAEVWDRPRLRMDTATLFEVFPNAFSWRTLGVIFGILIIGIGFFAGQESIGRAAWAASLPVPAYLIGLISIVVSASGLAKMVTGKHQYRRPQDFADMFFTRVLAQPGAPNYHFFERVAVPETLGLPIEHHRDETEVEVLSDVLHLWMEQTRQTLAHALLAEAGVPADIHLFEQAAVNAGEFVARNIQAAVGPSRSDGDLETSVHDAPVTFYRFSRNATFSFRAPESVLGHLTPEGHKLADSKVHATLTATVIRTPAGGWYVLDADLGDLQPGAAADTNQLV